MSRTRQHPDSSMFVRGNGIHSPQISTRVPPVQRTTNTKSSSPSNPSYMHTRAINYSEILSRHDPTYRAAPSRPSQLQPPRQRNPRNPSRNRLNSNSIIHNTRSTENISDTSTSTTAHRLGRINRLLRNNVSNINQPSSSISSSISSSNIHSQQQRNLMIQQYQQSLQMQQRLLRQRQQRLQQNHFNDLISILSENESVLRTREERESQLNRISAMSDEALSIIANIHSNLEQREDEEIFGIEYVDDENDLGIDEEMERVIERTLYDNDIDHDSSDEFDAEDESGNVIHVVKKRKKPNVPVTHLETREINEEELKSGLECPVCISEFSKGDVIAELKCGHIFHKDCVAEWVKKHPTCPVCRASTV